MTASPNTPEAFSKRASHALPGAENEACVSHDTDDDRPCIADPDAGETDMAGTRRMARAAEAKRELGDVPAQLAALRETLERSAETVIGDYLGLCSTGKAFVASQGGGA